MPGVGVEEINGKKVGRIRGMWEKGI